jgi:hypothetical protein
MLLLCNLVARDPQLVVIKLKELEKLLTCNQNVVRVTVAKGNLQHPHHILVLWRYRGTVASCNRPLLVPLPQNHLEPTCERDKKFFVEPTDADRYIF